jgi:transcriptional regulator with XRE-family HTH domain
MADTERHPRPLLRTLVGEVLRRHRQEQRRTLAEVAREANVSVQYLSEVERGRKEPSSEILAAICDSLRVELSDLLAEVRRDLILGRTPAPVLRLATTQLQRQSPAGPQMRGSGSVMLLAA